MHLKEKKTEGAREEEKRCNMGLIQIALHSEQHHISSLHLLSVTTGVVSIHGFRFDPGLFDSFYWTLDFWKAPKRDI